MGRLNRLKRMLSETHGREYVSLVGNATTGLWLIQKAMGLHNEAIAIPNSVCINVPLSVIGAGNRPLYVDILKENLGLAPERLAAITGRIGAVIAVHGYGAVCAIGRIQELCKERGVALIEDFAAAQGASSGGRPAGSFGDVSVVSFGAGKIIDAGHGGAVLTDDRDLHDEIERLEEDLPLPSPLKEERVSEFSWYHTCLYNEAYGRNLGDFTGDFLARAHEAWPFFLFRFDSDFEEVIVAGLCDMRRNTEERERKAQAFLDMSRGLAGVTFEPFIPPQGSVHWRLNIFMENGRDELLRRLLMKRFKISSWFPPADLFFEEHHETTRETPVSDWVGDHVLNIWVNDEADDRYLAEIWREMETFFRERERGDREIPS
jgi:dTDP-4-amino-4,6-dideoxygalactose transaminase